MCINVNSLKKCPLIPTSVVNFYDMQKIEGEQILYDKKSSVIASSKIFYYGYGNKYKTPYKFCYNNNPPPPITRPQEKKSSLIVGNDDTEIM